MGRNSKTATTIRAQRKYAHKAYIPGGPIKTDEVPGASEAEPTIPPVPPQPVVRKVGKTAAQLLDGLSLRNTHLHPEDIELLDLRVLLDRIKPSEVQKPSESVPAKQSPNKVTQEPRISKVSLKTITKKKIKKRPKRATRNEIKSLSRLNLRSRVITRSGVAAEKAKLVNLKAKNAPAIPQRRTSFTSEDNKPLMYFTKYKKRTTKDNATMQKQLTLPTKRTRQTAKSTFKGHNSQTQIKIKRKIRGGTEKRHLVIKNKPDGNFDRSSTASLFSVLNFGPPINMTEAFQIGNNNSSQQKTPIAVTTGNTDEDITDASQQEPSNTADEDITDASQQEPANTITAGSIQPNPLADFVIRIFNHDPEDCNRERGIDTQNSLNRVYEWFSRQPMTTNNANQASNDAYQFKMPATPQQRGNVAESEGSIITVPSSMNIREVRLRANCPAWNYKTLSEVRLNYNIIKWFCGDCTRCLVMYQPHHLRVRPSNLLIPVSPAECRSSDVYEFQSSPEDMLIPYRVKPIFLKISTCREPVLKLKMIMTEKGRKIFKAAEIIKDKVEGNVQLSSREDGILAQVIGILNECNARRIPARRPSSPVPSSSIQGSHIDVSGLGEPSVRLTRLAPPVQTPQQVPQMFYPTPEEFKECPIKFSCTVQNKYPSVSLCGIKPPENFKPTFRLGDSSATFKTKNQYIHRMLKRWGSATKQLTALRYKQNPQIQRSPLFEGLEVDLVKLNDTVQSEGGIEKCQNNHEKWKLVEQKMKIFSRGRANAKLENIYLKYLLNYNTLTAEEKEQAYRAIEQCWARRNINTLLRAQQPFKHQELIRSGVTVVAEEGGPDLVHLEAVCEEAEECITSGRHINYGSFQKLASQIQRTYFPGQASPTPEDVERVYFDIVMAANAHVCVHSASVDSVEYNRGFTNDPSDPYYDHPWNLKRVITNPNNMLSYLQPIPPMCSTSVMLGMLFSTSCWHKDPTSIPWIEYLHSGKPKIWYSIAASEEERFRTAVEIFCPFAVQNKDVWLASDIVLIPPSMLRHYGVNVQRHVQHPGEYVIVFPGTYCACVDTGMSVSEGVYFTPRSWIQNIETIFTNLRNTSEPSLFSMEKLLIAMARNESTPYPLLQEVRHVLVPLLYAELANRAALANRNTELLTPQVFLEQNQRATTSSWQLQPTGECCYCRCTLHLARVVGATKGMTGVCSRHGLLLAEAAAARGEQLNMYCILLVSNDEVYAILNAMQERVLGSAAVNSM